MVVASSQCRTLLLLYPPISVDIVDDRQFVVDFDDVSIVVCMFDRPYVV